MERSTGRCAVTITNPLGAKKESGTILTKIDNVVRAVRIFSESLLTNRVPKEVRQEVKALAAHMEILASRSRMAINKPRSPSAAETYVALCNLRRYLDRETNKDRRKKKTSASCTTDTLGTGSSQSQLSPCCSCLRSVSGYCNSRGDTNSHTLQLPMQGMQVSAQHTRLHCWVQSGCRVQLIKPAETTQFKKRSSRKERIVPPLAEPSMPPPPPLQSLVSSQIPSQYYSSPTQLPPLSRILPSTQQPQAQEVASLRYAAQMIRLTCSESLPLLLLPANEKVTKTRPRSVEDTRVHVLTEWASAMRSPEMAVASAASVAIVQAAEQERLKTFQGYPLLHCQSPVHTERAPLVIANQPLQEELHRPLELAIERMLDLPNLSMREYTDGCCCCHLNWKSDLNRVLISVTTVAEKANFCASVSSSVAVVGWAETRRVVMVFEKNSVQDSQIRSKRVVEEGLSNQQAQQADLTNSVTNPFITEVKNQSTESSKLIICSNQMLSVNSIVSYKPVVSKIQMARANRASLDNKATSFNQPAASNWQLVNMNVTASIPTTETRKPVTDSTSKNQINNRIIERINLTLISKELEIHNQQAQSIDSTVRNKIGAILVAGSHMVSSNQLVSTCSFPSDSDGRNENEQPMKKLRDMKDIIKDMRTSSTSLLPLKPAPPLGHGSIEATTIPLLQGVCESSCSNEIIISSAGVSIVSPNRRSGQQPQVRIVDLVRLVRTAESKSATDALEVTIGQSTYQAVVVNTGLCDRSNSTLEVVDNRETENLLLTGVDSNAAARTTCILEPTTAGGKAEATWSSYEVGQSSGFTKLLQTLDRAKRRREKSRGNKQRHQQKHETVRESSETLSKKTPVAASGDSCSILSNACSSDSRGSCLQNRPIQQESQPEQKLQPAVSTDSDTTGAVAQRQEEALKMAALSLTELARNLQVCIERVHQAADVISRSL